MMPHGKSLFPGCPCEWTGKGHGMDSLLRQRTVQHMSSPWENHIQWHLCIYSCKLVRPCWDLAYFDQGRGG